MASATWVGSRRPGRPSRGSPARPADYASPHPAPRELGAAWLVLGLDRPLPDVYWVAVNGADMPFLAVVEHTNMVDPAEYGGRHLV